jgi:hypothetical protein
LPSDAELFYVWKHAKEEGYISSDVPVPRDGLNWVAINNDLAEEGELEERTFSGERGEYSVRHLPREAYNAALEYIEDELDVDSGRNQASSTTASTGPPVPSGPPASAFESEAVKNSENPVTIFFDAYLQPANGDGDGESGVFVNTLYELYTRWAEINDLDVTTKAVLARKLSGRYGDDYERVRASEAPRPYYYDGIVLSPRGRQLRQRVEDDREYPVPAGPSEPIPDDTTLFD